jgi:mannose-6-phosphate isomerase-like protein (cupin superfamily)
VSVLESYNTVISKDTAEHYTWGDSCDGWQLVDRAGLSVIHERMPPGTAEVWHHHQIARQFFVLSGTATIELGGQIHTLRAQQGIEIAPGLPHQMHNDSNADVEFLVISQPTTRGIGWLRGNDMGGPRAQVFATALPQSG